MYKQKLIDLLKSDEQVKEAMEKLVFWCKIKNFEWEDTVLKYLNWITYWINREYYNLLWVEIIWLPLQERFIRMYWNNNCKNWNILTFNNNWYIEIFNDEWEFSWEYIKLDNTKDFDNQDDIVYKKIYEALLELNK